MLKEKLLEWFKRYIPLEVFSYIVIVITILISTAITDNTTLVALLGTYLGYIGYFFLAIIREMRNTNSLLEEKGLSYTKKDFFLDIRNLFLEFAPAITLRFSILSYAVILMQKIIEDPYYGQLGGNILSDLIFYIIVIISYEIIKKRLKKEKSNNNQNQNNPNSSS